ncbi:YggT family protein [Aquamicrobium sp. LC103]|uniref:YggT family protein n=1 Tax=Aquamicrobium sp. LC103 TaxID=1120658 RepID=UPI00063E9891|nr:YggT family protein [Aquamicrobium sp. LC103]TKT79289.1 YggT family protein [Aquamicrobium sp. LC103]
MSSFWTYWYFHIPNFVLAAVMYTLLGRIVLGLFVPENWDNYIWRAFKAITEPFVRFFRMVTPRIMTHLVVMLFGVLWLMFARVAYFVLLLNLGLTPVATQGAGS